MSRIRQVLGALIAGTMILSLAFTTSAQETGVLDPALRAQMAAITLDRAALPEDYRFVGETFLNAGQAAEGGIDAEALTAAGFQALYASVYQNQDSGYAITSYVSAWTDDAAATAGFDLTEDESVASVDGTFTDAETTIGEEPRETTTGTYPDPADTANTIGVVDTTFRNGRFLVGVSLMTSDGTEPDASLVESLAGTLEARATTALGGESPAGTDLALVAQVVPLAGFGVELQAGFLDSGDAETMYGLTGSALGDLSATWTEVVGLGESAAPYVSVGVTRFSSPETALSVFEQVGELAAPQPNVAAIDGVEIEGATATSANSFPSLATGATEADSVRVFALAGDTLIVVDVQGAPSVEVAQETATTLASAQVGCVGASACEAPALPEGLAA